MITRNKMFARRFFPAMLAALVCAASSSAQQLTIESPSPGTIFSAGQTINVTVSVTNGPVLAVQVFGQGMGTTALKSAAPFTFTLTAPSNVIGLQNVFAIGALGQGDAVFSPTIAVDIEPTSAPTSIVFNQSLATLGYVGDQRRVWVSATFADGSTQDVSNSTNLTYSSSAPAVTSIDSTGLMTCQGIGGATITATYGKLTATLQTQGPSGVPGDLNGDFVVNSDDLALLELMLGDIPTLPGDGRNLDGHTTIDAGDVSALLLLCNSACPFLGTTTTALAGVPAQIAFAQPLQLTAMVTGLGTTKPTGGVTFLVDGKVQDVGTLMSSNEAYVTLTSLAAGSHTIEALYGGDTSNAPSTSASVTTQVLAPVISSIDAVPASLSIAPAATDQFTAYSVFSDGSVQNATPTATWASSNTAVATIGASSGLATAIGPGTVQITATVGGIASPPVTLTVMAAAAITPTVTVSPSPSSITTAQSTMVTVTVSSSGATPTGSVTLTSGTYTSAATTLTSGSAVITVPGSSLSTGVNTLTATYTPDSNSSSIYNSAMGTNSVTVTAAATPGLALSNNGPITFEASATIGNTATVSVAPSNGFTGAVNLTCAVTIAPPAAISPATCAVTPSVTISGTTGQNATLTVTTTSTTTVGAYAVTVTGTSGTISQNTVVNVSVTAYVPPPTFSLTNNGPITFEASAATGNTAIVSVTPSNGFTGAVNLTCAVTTTLTNPTSPATCSVTPSVTITGATAQNSTLTVSTTTTTTAGAYAVTVTGTSGAIMMPTTVNVTVNAYIAPSFTLTNGGAITISSPGATTGNTTTITVMPSGGFTGNVTLTAAVASSPSGATDPPTFSFGATSPVSITGASNGTGALTVTTTATTTGTLVHPKSLRAPWYAAGGTALACLLFFGIPARRRRWRSMLGMLVLFVLLTGGLVSCGSKSSGGGTGSLGTTTGSYTITITGTSGSIMQTTTVNLTVN